MITSLLEIFKIKRKEKKKKEEINEFKKSNTYIYKSIIYRSEML
jgi:hypothetical protein